MCCSDAPDTSGMNRAAEANAAIAQQALDWYRQTYAQQAPDRAAAAQRANQVADAQVDAMTTATAQAKDLDTYNKTTFRPLEQKIVADAQTFDTPVRRIQAAAEAAADVDASTAATRQATDMALARSGIAPGSARAMMVQEDTAGNAVKARAGAMTTAVRNIEQQGYARQVDAANLGRNIASAQATQQQIATNAGAAGVSAGTAALGATQSGNTTLQQGFQTAISGNTAAGNLYGQAAQIDAQSNSGLMSGIAGLAGAAGSLGWKPFSDERMKKGTGRMADTAKALQQVEDTTVEEGWQYDPAAGGPDDGGKKHIGPMRKTVAKAMGKDAVAGEHQIDLVNMNGRMLAAVQELSKRVKALEKETA